MQNCFNTNTGKECFRITPIPNSYFPVFPEVLLIKLGFQCKLQEINFLLGMPVFCAMPVQLSLLPQSSQLPVINSATQRTHLLYR